MLVFILKSVAPVASATLLWKLYAYLSGRQNTFLWNRSSKLATLFNMLIAGETVFVIYCAHLKAVGQKKFDKVDMFSKQQRESLFKKCLDTVPQPEMFAQAWLRDFPFSEIRRGNVEEWLSWGFFVNHFNSLKSDEKEEIDNYIDQLQQRAGKEILDGHNGLIKPFRFNMEPVESSHRPLVYYGIVHGVVQRVIAPMSLMYLGFQSRQKSTNSFNYWYRAVDHPEDTPLVFIHGIGIGVLPYVHFLHRLIQASKPRNILVIELGQIAQQLNPCALEHESFCQDLCEVFKKLNMGPARFIGHSYGTFIVSWVMKYCPQLVESAVFLDPGCFLLHFTKCLKAIIYKDAMTEAEKLFQYFLRSELNFNNHCRRHFLWYRNILFFDEIKCKAVVIISDQDDIMPVDEIREYHKDHDSIELIELEHTPHGGFLYMPHHLDLVVSKSI